MNNFHGFDDQKNGAGILALLAGLASGTGAFLLVVREWWAWGWGPGNWSRADILHSYWLAFFGHSNPSYKGDLGTWLEFETLLRRHHQYDAFVASFWVPFLVGTMVGLLVGFWIFKSMNKKPPAFIRGGRFN